MIIGLLKSLFYMFVFYIFLRFIGYIVKFLYFLSNKNFQNNKASYQDNKTLKMLQCEKCKVYVAKSEAYISNGRVFCKKEHFF